MVSESQCGFRKHRGTVDMVFAIRQLQEKCVEQQQDLHLLFIDLTKAFDTVNGMALWSVLHELGCPPKFIQIIRSFHEGIAENLLSTNRRVAECRSKSCNMAGYNQQRHYRL